MKKIYSIISLTFVGISLCLLSCSDSENIGIDITNDIDTQVTRTKTTNGVSPNNDGKVIVYVDPKNYNNFSNLGEYTLNDGSSAIDIVCIFAANFVLAEPPYLRAQNNPDAEKSFNTEIDHLLRYNISAIRDLQNKGIKVLLTILGGHHEGGWSNFASEVEAQRFVDYIKRNIIDVYHLDGIDIDDEYSKGTPHNNSLAMVTSLMRRTMPDKLITKALWDDGRYFNASWQGNKLADNLDFGAEMSYSYWNLSSRLTPYINYGMSNTNLFLGFSAENQFTLSREVMSERTQTVVDNGYAGIMLYNFGNRPNGVDMLEGAIHGMHGEWHDWNTNN